MVEELDPLPKGEAELYFEDYDARICCEWTPCVQVFNSTITKVCSNVRDVEGFPYRPRRDPSTAELLLKTIVAVNQLSIDGAAAIWCNSNSTEDSFDFNKNCDISPRLTTHFARHENPDLCHQAPRHRLQTVCERTSPVEFNSLAQGCREAGISKLVDRGTILCDPTGCSSE